MLLVFSACSDDPDPSALAITTRALPSGVTGRAYEAPLAADGEGAKTWSAEGLPAGLELVPNQEEARIVGAPERAGTARVDVVVRTADAEDRRTYELVVRAAPLEIERGLLPEGEVGDSYRATIRSRGGVAPLRWSLVEGRLPAGLVFASTDDVATITGTPEAPFDAQLLVQVEDADGARAERSFDLLVRDGALRLVTSSLPPGEAGATYTATIAGRGGEGPYAWRVVGAAPAGLRLVESETLETTLVGAPERAGDYRVEVELSDAVGATTSTRFDLHVAIPEAFAITTALLPDSQVDTPYAATIASGAGAAPYVWRISGGALPPGVTLDSSAGATVDLSGRPTAVGSFSFTVEVVDGLDRVAERRLSIYVQTEPPIAILTPSLPSSEVGLPVDLPLLASGGAAPYSWAVVGALPEGLEIDALGTPTSRIHGVPTRIETVTFEIEVVDRNVRRARRSYTMTIEPSTEPLVVTSPPAPPGELCLDYYFEVEAAGGARGGYAWSIVNGALPPGLSIDRTGEVAVVYGVPQIIGSHTFTVVVEDHVQDSTRRTFTIDIGAASEPRYGLIASKTSSNKGLLYPVDRCAAAPTQQLPIVQPMGSDVGITDASAIRFAPTSDRAAYVAQQNGEFRVFVLDLRGTPSAVAVSQPLVPVFASFASASISWSPDGQRLAYVAPEELVGSTAFVVDVTDPANPGPRIAVVPPDAPEKTVTTPVVWAPNSQRLAFIGDVFTDNVFEVVVAEVTSSTMSVSIVSGPQGPGQQVVSYPPAWSTDSSHVLFTAELRESRREVFSVDVRAARPLPVPIAPNAPSAASYQPYALAPDGTKMTYVANHGAGGFQAYLVDLTAPPFAPTRVGPPLATGQSVLRVVWSPTSDRLLYLVPAAGLTNTALYLVDTSSAGASVRIDAPVPPGQGIRTHPDGVSFDGQGSAVVYLADANVRTLYEPFFVDLSGPTPATPLAINPYPGTGRVYGVGWARDVRRLALVVEPPMIRDGYLYIVDLTDGAPTTAVRIGEDLNTSVGYGSETLVLDRSGSLVYFLAGTGSQSSPFATFTAGPTATSGTLLTPSPYRLERFIFP